MTNHAAFAYADVPLFLFHLLEFSGVDFDLDVEELNQRWADPKNIDSWSQLVIKHTNENVDLDHPRAAERHLATWRSTAACSYHRFDYHRAAVESEREAYFLRISGPGDYRYEGADLGILVTRGRSMNDDFTLNERAQHWIRGIKSGYQAKPLVSVEAAQPAPTPGRVQDPLIGWKEQASGLDLIFEAIAEDGPGPKWSALFDRHWDAYRRWFLQQGDRARPYYLASLRALRQHMPELVPTYERVVRAGRRRRPGGALPVSCTARRRT